MVVCVYVGLRTHMFHGEHHGNFYKGNVMGEAFTVNSVQTKAAYHAYVDRTWEEHKWLTFLPPRIGEDRSIPQNNLFHVWLTEYAAFLTPCHTKEVTAGMLKGIKRSAKGLFYREYGYEWMVHKVICPLTKREKTDYTSSSSWAHGEMFMVLTWLQNFAGSQGCILESKGQFKKLQREQNGA